ncbi:MAG: M23 family metallopeptidase [Rhodocyclales bacterium]|nr:M23 family metallopeptidase [Rhodocyclales bacterium]
MKIIVALIGTALILFGASSVHARSGQKKLGAEPEQAAEADSTQDKVRHGIQPSGLVPNFANDAKCTAIASSYASATRYDGSTRPQTRFGGLHGGIDLTLDEKTPLLAIASGKVIASGVGGRAEGIYIWLQHAPKDTGLPFWTYSKYQHLSALPTPATGDYLKAGDIVGLSGSTGTAGGHYGASGYAHLHLTVLAGSSDQYHQDGSRIIPEGARMIDPLAVFLQGLTNLDDIEVLSESRRNVKIGYAAADGSIHPAGSRTVWPVACK